MAKRKKAKRSSRRRRIGAIALNANSPVTKIASLGAGYVLSNQITAALEKVTGGKIDSKIVNGILAAGGLYLSMKGKSNLLKVLGGIAAGAGAKGLLKDFGVISGFRSIPVLGGFNKVPVIGGYNVPQPTLNGVGGYTVPSSSSIMGKVGNIADPDDGGLLRGSDE
jgi:hypothetical protein